MSGSGIIIEESDRLPNVHPGDILRHDFLIGEKIPLTEVALKAGIGRARLETILHRTTSIDADVELRLARYFGMSDEFFLGLQADFDLEEAKRLHGAELDCITPRAA